MSDEKPTMGLPVFFQMKCPRGDVYQVRLQATEPGKNFLQISDEEGRPFVTVPVMPSMARPMLELVARCSILAYIRGDQDGFDTGCGHVRSEFRKLAGIPQDCSVGGTGTVVGCTPDRGRRTTPFDPWPTHVLVADEPVTDDGRWARIQEALEASEAEHLAVSTERDSAVRNLSEARAQLAELRSDLQTARAEIAKLRDGLQAAELGDVDRAYQDAESGAVYDSIRKFLSCGLYSGLPMDAAWRLHIARLSHDRAQDDRRKDYLYGLAKDADESGDSVLRDKIRKVAAGDPMPTLEDGFRWNRLADEGAE